MFRSTTKESLSNFIPILHPEGFMLCRKAVYNGLSLELYTPFNLHLRTKSVPLSFSYILMYQMLVDKQTYFEINHNL